MAVNSQLPAAVRNQTMTTQTVRLFLVLIVALGIASVLVVSVVQKQREIGVLRAIGASPPRVTKVFLIQGGIVGAVGTTLGFGLATLITFAASRVLIQVDGTPLIPPSRWTTAWGPRPWRSSPASSLPLRLRDGRPDSTRWRRSAMAEVLRLDGVRKVHNPCTDVEAEVFCTVSTSVWQRGSSPP